MRSVARRIALPVLAIALSCLVPPAALAEDDPAVNRGPEAPHRSGPVGGPLYGIWPTDLAGPARPVVAGQLSVELKVRPGRALVAVDGKPAGKVRRFSTLESPLWLTPGTHVIEISAPGYQTLSLRVDPAEVPDHDLRYKLRKGEGRDARSS